MRHVTRYNIDVIKSFADRETQRLFETGSSRRLPTDLLRRAIRRLEYKVVFQLLVELARQSILAECGG